MSPITATTPDDSTAIVSADVALPADAAWHAFVDAATLARWYWPERLRTDYEVDARPGGIWRVRSEVLELGYTAVYGEVLPSERFSASWQWDDDAAVSRIDVTFDAIGSGTRVTVTHSDNPTVEARDLHRQGWIDCLTRLTALAPA